MRNEDRVNFNRANHPITRRLVPRQNWDTFHKWAKRILLTTIIGVGLGGFIYGLMYAVHQQSYDYSFCNLSQNDINTLTNGSDAVTCLAKREWQGTWIITFKTKGNHGTIRKFISDNNISCWKEN